LREGGRQAKECCRSDKEKLLHRWVFLSKVKFREGAARASSSPLTGSNTRVRKRLRCGIAKCARQRCRPNEVPRAVERLRTRRGGPRRSGCFLRGRWFVQPRW
jgi:hypothetical protein